MLGIKISTSYPRAFMDAEEAFVLLMGRGISVVKESALAQVGWEAKSKMVLDVLEPSSKEDGGQVLGNCKMWV